MQKKTFFLVSALTVVYFAESSPIKVSNLEFDNFDGDNTDLGYEQDDQSWSNLFSKVLLGETTKKPSKDAKASKESENERKNVKTTGLKKKNQSTKGVHGTHSSGDLETFFKSVGVHDHGDNYDADSSARTDAIASTAAVTKGKETRTYARRNKTTGFHRVHHKDEYKKDQEFYENDETKGTINRAGAKASGTKVKAGAGFHKGSFKHDRQKGIRGKQGYLDNGFLDKQFSEFGDFEDTDTIFSNELDI